MEFPNDSLQSLNYYISKILFKTELFPSSFDSEHNNNQVNPIFFGRGSSIEVRTKSDKRRRNRKKRKGKWKKWTKKDLYFPCMGASPK